MKLKSNEEYFRKNLKFINRVSKFDEKKFKIALDNKLFHGDRTIERAMIFVHDLKSDDKTKSYNEFYQKYLVYLKNLLDSNPEEYCNNEFCKMLIFDNAKSLQEITPFNKTLFEVLAIIANLLYKSMNNLNDYGYLNLKDKQFIENEILMETTSLMVDTEKPYEYFSIYPATKLDTPRDRLLYLISTAALKINSLGTNCFFKISKDEEKKHGSGDLGLINGENGEKSFLILLNGITEEKIMDDSYFATRLYVLYHEIGHLNLEVNKNDYNEMQRLIFKIEYELLENNNDFYNKYHDDFFIEKDANSFAIMNLRNDFKNNIDVLKLCDYIGLSLIDCLDRNDDYISLLLSEYDKLKSSKEKKHS